MTLQILRADARKIWEAALRAVDPAAAVRRCVKRRRRTLTVDGQSTSLEGCEHIWVLGAGKAAASMGWALERVLGDYLSGGLVVTKYGHGLPLMRIEVIEAGHPLPDANGVVAGERIAQMAREKIGPRDLVFWLLSGGGSALLVSAAEGVSLQDKLNCTQLLLQSGAAIQEMNAVRKHLSGLKGGGLARLLSGVPAISLILSDVVGDRLDTIASGPLVPDHTTYHECLEILQRYRIADRVPSTVLRRLEAGAAGRIPETPKPGDPAFQRKRNVIVASNSRACGAAAAAARRLGYHTAVLTSSNEGDTRESAGFHLSVLREIISFGRPLRRPACLISGGETTVRVKGSGLGGRNQEFVLQTVRPLAHLAAPCLVASLGTDGTDGPTDAAGALADNTSLTRSLQHGARFLDDALADNDSYRFFARLEDGIVTGPTRTNVMDLRILLVGSADPHRSPPEP